MPGAYGIEQSVLRMFFFIKLTTFRFHVKFRRVVCWEILMLVLIIDQMTSVNNSELAHGIGYSFVLTSGIFMNFLVDSKCHDNNSWFLPVFQSWLPPIWAVPRKLPWEVATSLFFSTISSYFRTSSPWFSQFSPYVSHILMDCCGCDLQGRFAGPLWYNSLFWPNFPDLVCLNELLGEDEAQ